MTSMPDNTQSIKRQALLDKTQAIALMIDTAHQIGTPMHEVERDLLKQ